MNSEVEPLRIEFPASPDELPGVRSRLRRWLAGMIADSQRAYDLLLAAGGHWVARPAAPDDERGHTESLRGRGLQMIKALVHESRVTVLDSGTTVTLSMPLDADGAGEGSQAR